MINRIARKRALKEAQEEREDQQLVKEELLQWEKSEALVDTQEDPDLQMALALSRSLEDGGTKRSRSLSSTPSVESSTLMLMSAQERDAWDEAQRHRRRLKDMNSIMGMQYKVTQELDRQVWKQDRKLWEIQQENLDLKQRIADQEQQARNDQQRISDLQQTIDALQSERPPLGTLIHLGRNQHKRRKGRILGPDDKRAVLHCLDVCVQERALGPGISTNDPYLRTATYLGVSQNSVRRTALREEKMDGRGKWRRYCSVRLMASDLREKAAALDLEGKAVTLNRLHKYIKDSWPSSYGIPGRETIRKIMCTMGFQYKNVGTTRNFIETPESRGLRREYLKGWYLDEFKDALFVWLDESYCNQYHVTDKSWFVPGMTVLRKNATNRGRRYVIVHAGSADGWIGSPRVWEAKSGGDDYHSNMNSDIFEAYMKDLCDDCQSRGYLKVVFCMDNAAYHRRLVQNPESKEETRRKTLSQYKKDELVEHLLWQDSNLIKDDLKKLTRTALYDMAKRPEYRAPFAVQQLVQEYGYHVLWLPPYHPDLNPTEEAWGVTKGHVLYENDGTSFAAVRDLIFEGFEKAAPTWPDLVKRAIQNEQRYIEQDRIHLNEAPGLPLAFETDSEDESEEDEDEAVDSDALNIDYNELGDSLNE